MINPLEVFTSFRSLLDHCSNPSFFIICDQLSKNSHVWTQTEIILFPQLIATYNYAGSLSPLANVNWSAFPECDHVNSQLVKWCQW